MKIEDLEIYKKDGTKSSKSQLKEFIKLYATVASELKNEKAIEINSIKKILNNNIQKKFI